MDRIGRAVDIARALNKFNIGELKDFQFIEKVCEYFDFKKSETLSIADKKFLIHLANKSGIPQYYDMLNSFNLNGDYSIQDEDLSMQTLSALLYESSLFSSSSKLHKYQKQILDKFQPKKLNRYFLSASTSFGKTHIVFEIIKKMKYSNVALIFPTIALLSENLEKMLGNSEDYIFFKRNYKVHTLSEVKEFGEKNLFIYTPERFLSFLEKHPNSVEFDFAFVDEVYKIDNEYIIDEEARENERDTAYRLAVYYALSNNRDALFAGPYVEFFRKGSNAYNSSFDNFLTFNSIELINYNNYEIVDKSYDEIIKGMEIVIDDNLEFEFTKKGKTDRLIEATTEIIKTKQNVIIYCAERGKRAGVEKYAGNLISSQNFSSHDYQKYGDLIEHISNNFPKDWIAIEALKNGIGIHHGLIPKYIQKEIIRLFNNGLINVLISTTTITEGVNTSAKNLIVLHNKKGGKELRKFDAKNIAGRAGRFGYHYSGRVLILDKDFLKTINSEEEGIRHKNYDINSTKKEIDLFYTNDEFLSESDKSIKLNIKIEQAERGIPDDIINHYKVVSRKDKIIVYDRIIDLSETEIEELDKLFYAIRVHTNISFEGFTTVLNVIRPIVKNNKEVEGLIDTLIYNKSKEKEYPVLCSLVFAYLQGGIKGSIKYKKETQHKDTDKAISETSKFVYNTLKYQVVKYLGVFNIMYKFRVHQTTGRKIEDISALDKLLMKFEYNALTDDGRIVSDYGVPGKVLEYYEQSDKSESIKKSFDNYEQRIFEIVDKVVNANKS